jgi:hypothetical protein
MVRIVGGKIVEEDGDLEAQTTASNPTEQYETPNFAGSFRNFINYELSFFGRRIRLIFVIGFVLLFGFIFGWKALVISGIISTILYFAMAHYNGTGVSDTGQSSESRTRGPSGRKLGSGAIKTIKDLPKSQPTGS